ncbi:MAG: CDP-alcohol phosphatidyltransferase family protein [Myxococcota bacterium]
MPDPRTPARIFDHSLLLGVAFAWACLSGKIGPLILISLWVFGAWIWRMRGRYTPSGRFGAANVITALRFGIALWMAMLSPEARIPGGGVLLMLFFALDGLDGRLARKSGQSSDFGATFDMETDALMTAVSCFVAVEVGVAGVWLLLVGGLRYVFVLLTSHIGRGPEPPRRWGRWAYSLMVVGLTAALTLPNDFTELVLALGGVAVIASFGRSFVWSFFGR